MTITLQPAPFDWDNYDWETDPLPDEDAEAVIIEKKHVVDGYIISGTKQIDVDVISPDDPGPPEPQDQ